MISLFIDECRTCFQQSRRFDDFLSGDVIFHGFLRGFYESLKIEKRTLLHNRQNHPVLHRRSLDREKNSLISMIGSERKAFDWRLVLSNARNSCEFG